MKKALISVSDKSGLAELGMGLVAAGYDILSTGGTAKDLQAAGVPVTEVADHTGFPEMMDGRVKTLHPKIHGGILGVRSKAEHQASMLEHGIEPVDLVVVNLYPFRATIAKEGVTWEDAIENIDIGGPAMVRSASKNHESVTVVVDPGDYQMVLAELTAKGEVSIETRKRLAGKAFAHTAAYDLAIAQYVSGGRYDGMIGERVMDLRYGENPHQKFAALFRDSSQYHPFAPDKFSLVGGEAPSYINITDLYSSLETAVRIAVGLVKNFGHTPCIAIGVKHGAPCGVGVAGTAAEALEKLLHSDPTSLHGGTVILTSPLDEAAAEFLRRQEVVDKDRILDVVIAPDFTDAAIRRLDRKYGKCRMFKNGALGDLATVGLDTSRQYRQVWAGFLVQDPHLYVFTLNDEEKDRLSERQQWDLVIAWAIGTTVPSNTIVHVYDGYLVGRGIAQPSRVAACEVAILLARMNGHEADLQLAVSYSDSFFIAGDGPQVLAEAGIKVVFATSGSMNDAQVQEACGRLNLMLIQRPDKEARGFRKH